MSEYNELVRFSKAKLPLALIQYPTGRWGFAGRIPAELCHEYKDRITPGPTYRSNVYETEAEARQAAAAINATICN